MAMDPQIDLESVRRSALRHEIRSAHPLEDQQRRLKKAQLQAYETELRAKVEEHLEDLHKSEAKKADLAKLKEELLAKVREHMEIVSLYQGPQLARLQQEFLEKVKKATT